MSDRVLIVDALAAGSGRRTSSRDTIGIGPRAIAGVLERHDIDCRIARVEDLLSTPSRLRGYAHLAVSAMSMDLPATRRLLGLWRSGPKRGRVILGGPICSAPELGLKEMKPDVVVVGEGETTLDELLTKGFFEKKVDVSDVLGIGYLDRGSPRFNSLRPLMSSDALSRIVPSTERIVDYPAYQACRVYVEVLRGCSNYRRPTIKLVDGRRCTDCGNCDSDDYSLRLECPENIPPGCGFCSVPATWGPPRSRAVTAIVGEIRALIDSGVHRIVLEAPDFLDYQRGPEPLTDPCLPEANLDALEQLLRAVAGLPKVSDGDCHIGIENVKACLFTDDVAQLFSEVIGFTSPNIGLETGSDAHLRQIGKCGSREDVKRAVVTARRYGMSPFIYLIYGLPGETPETVSESVRIMQELRAAGAERIILYGFHALPASAFEGFPASTPNDPVSASLRAASEEINRARKDAYVGREVRGIAAEPSLDKHGYTMVYPLGEGPIMTVQGGYSSGAIVTVRITKVLSAGLVGGDVISSQ
jgi:radical SAM superfamily enzyme YgiQ (UPF0313 family)